MSLTTKAHELKLRLACKTGVIFWCFSGEENIGKRLEGMEREIGSPVQPKFISYAFTTEETAKPTWNC